MSSSVGMIIKIIDLYTLFLVIRILLTWFPSVNFYDPPLSWLAQITDPFLNLFRSIIPPLGGFDLSPILAFLLLNLVKQVLVQVAFRSGGGFV
jgi:YggT family protein